MILFFFYKSYHHSAIWNIILKNRFIYLVYLIIWSSIAVHILVGISCLALSKQIQVDLLHHIQFSDEATFHTEKVSWSNCRMWEALVRLNFLNCREVHPKYRFGLAWLNRKCIVLFSLQWLQILVLSMSDLTWKYRIVYYLIIWSYLKISTSKTKTL